MTARRHAALNFPGFIVVLAAMGVWQLVATFVIKSTSLPAPTSVARALASLWRTEGYWSDLSYTVLVSITSVAIAIVVGVAGGLVVALSPLAKLFTLSTLDVLRTLPVVALMPVALLLWGPTTKSEIIASAYAALWPCFINTADAVAYVHPRLTEVAHNFQLGRSQRVRKIIIPAVWPQIRVGIRLSLVIALVVTILSEMLVSAHGLGWDLVRAQTALQASQVWAIAVTLGVVGYVLNKIAQRIGTVTTSGR